MRTVELPDATGLLAADVLRLESELATIRRDAAMWRDMALEALSLLHIAVRAHYELTKQGRP